MTYETELRFLQSIIEKIGVDFRILDAEELSERILYPNLRQLIDDDGQYERVLQETLRTAQHRTIYRTRDAYECRYLFLLLPEVGRDTVLFIGPYLDREMSREEVLELGERLGLSPRRLRYLDQHYISTPVISDEGLLFSVVTAFADRIWGGSEQYSLRDFNHELAEIIRRNESPEKKDPEEFDWKMKILEQRYASENEMMHAVSHGLTHKVETMFSHFSQLSIEQRMADPVRNLKNYAIVMNTLLRKAAEQGGVHPVYLDEISAEYSKQIEQVNSLDAVQKLMAKIGPGYCRLVIKHASGTHSQLVQRMIACIDADVTADLTLHALAERFSVNSSYLSTLFHKETGMTVTEYVNRARIEAALRLLSGTKLQIQTIAQHCGILDVNYFSKLFKKYTGLSPMEWRRQSQIRKPV